MNTDDMTREELIAHYEHRIACERQSHADRLAAAEKAFALWRKRLSRQPELTHTTRQALSRAQFSALNEAIIEAMESRHSGRSIEGLCIECESLAAELRQGEVPEVSTFSAQNLASSSIEVLLRTMGDL